MSKDVWVRTNSGSGCTALQLDALCREALSEGKVVAFMPLGRVAWSITTLKDPREPGGT